MSGGAPSRGFVVEHYPEVASTNDLARQRAERGAEEGLVILADRQVAGRGRHGRAWDSPLGNLYASVLLRPRAPLASSATLSLVAALAVIEALDPFVGDRSRLRAKWPNDVLLDGNKTAGVLLEGADDGRGNTAWLVIGIGVNVARAPEALARGTTSVQAATGVAVTPRTVLDRLLDGLAHRYADWGERGFTALRAAWLARAHGVGSAVTLRLGDEAIQGRFADLGEDGSLLLENELGCLTRYTAGELFFG